MKRISGSFSELMLLLLLAHPVPAQDTLRTYGPRIGIDLARFGYLFADPAQTGAEFSLDAEVFPDIYPVLEAGYNSLSQNTDLYRYRTGGAYARIGADYNLLAPKEKSIHHSLTAGIRYGISFFSHKAGDITIPSDYWGDAEPDEYMQRLTGHWLELAGGVKTELVPNCFLGWSVRYKILVNPGMDPQVTPLLIPGYGRGTGQRGFGFTYQFMYKIPIIKK